jgi:hypothetical protein
MQINPYYAARIRPRPKTTPQVHYANLPRATNNTSPIPHLTSHYHFSRADEYGERTYHGNCSKHLIKDLLRYFQPASVFDPMTGSGTCGVVCDELAIYCWSSDLHQNADACDASQFPRGCFEFAWIHPPYWRQKLYCDDPRDLSRTPTLAAFLDRYRLLIENCAGAIVPSGALAVLMGDYCDREAGIVPLTYYTKQLAFETGLRQCCTDIIRISHGAPSGQKVDRGCFIPGLHDVCMVFDRQPTESKGVRL